MGNFSFDYFPYSVKTFHLFIYWLLFDDGKTVNCFLLPHTFCFLLFNSLFGFISLFIQKYIYICCTLRSWLHEISALIMILSPGLENNYILERSSKSFPGITCISGFLENCQKYIPKSQCSPIRETMSLNV